MRTSGLVTNSLSHSTIRIILGSKSAEDYQHLAENQQLSDQAIYPAHKSVEKFPKIFTFLPATPFELDARVQAVHVKPEASTEPRAFF